MRPVVLNVGAYRFPGTPVDVAPRRRDRSTGVRHHHGCGAHRAGGDPHFGKRPVHDRTATPGTDRSRLCDDRSMTRRPASPLAAGGDPHGRAGVVHRFPLNRRMILAGAVALIDESDLSHLTMRRLGAALGVEGMTLYGYVHSREDLLDGIVDLVVGELPTPPAAVSVVDWTEYVYLLARGVRGIALAHPQVFPLVATRPAIARWVRPPIRSLRWTEALLEVLHRSGVLRSGSGLRVPGVHQLPARAPVAGGRRRRGGHHPDQATRPVTGPLRSPRSGALPAAEQALA